MSHAAKIVTWLFYWTYSELQCFLANEVLEIGATVGATGYNFGATAAPNLAREQLAELDLFFRHTHTNKDYAWRMPEDLQLLKPAISKDEKKNLSFITIKLFTVDELQMLLKTGTLVQKLITSWCLNCSHGAAEIGRVTSGNLYLSQDHPLRSQGLEVEPGGNWTGFLRHKTDVVGWWQLWPETVELVKQWKPEAERLLGRKVNDSDRIILPR